MKFLSAFIFWSLVTIIGVYHSLSEAKKKAQEDFEIRMTEHFKNICEES